MSKEVKQMEKLALSSMSLETLQRLTRLTQNGIRNYEWTQVDAAILSDWERRRLAEIQTTLLRDPVHLLNEATIWARGIYPLLQLAESDEVRALAGITLKVHYPQFEIEGVADGAIGKSIMGRIDYPYLVTVEAKRGIEGQNPVSQLYGSLLAAARLNWQTDGQDVQEVFGCYTIADSWAFVRSQVSGIDSDRPTLEVEFSREYTEKTDAETILKLLKAIVARYQASDG